MIEALSFPFMQRALAAGLIVGILAGYYGAFIVQRGLAFLGNGLAHAAFGGVALGILLELEPLWVSIPFTIAAAVGITWVRAHSNIGDDSSIGIFMATSMALGIIFISMRQEYSASAINYLFGSILAVSANDLVVGGGILGVTVCFLPFWRRWAYATFDRELAEADRIPVQRDDYILSILVALTVVISVKIVGIVLVTASLIIPAATARLYARTFFQMTVGSVLVGILTSILGLTAAYYFNLPGGAAIILLQAVVFFFSLVIVRK